ncbi:MAG: D-alanyl-D-alanine carboxypeptidase family protein [Betaproteobacteria bacterium]
MIRKVLSFRGVRLFLAALLILSGIVAGFTWTPAIRADDGVAEAGSSKVQEAAVPQPKPDPAPEPQPDSAPEPPPKPAPEPPPELILVNKEHALPADYVPDDLRVVEIPFLSSEDSPKKMLREVAAAALENLFAAAEQDGIQLVGISGYRSYATQAEIFNRNATRYGSEEAANRVSARPGESEHQTGLAMDVSAPSVNYQLTEALGQTEEGDWLEENAARFGFIIRYPEGKEDVTGYQYEPWHLRYVGVPDAVQIAEGAVTLEEYLQDET